MILAKVIKLLKHLYKNKLDKLQTSAFKIKQEISLDKFKQQL